MSETFYFRVLVKCLRCALHYVVLTDSPEQHNHKGLYCPECGTQGSKLVTKAEKVQGYISQEQNRLGWEG